MVEAVQTSETLVHYNSPPWRASNHIRLKLAFCNVTLPADAFVSVVTVRIKNLNLGASVLIVYSTSFEPPSGYHLSHSVVMSCGWAQGRASSGEGNKTKLEFLQPNSAST
jgi:hypothetical protein